MHSMPLSVQSYTLTQYQSSAPLAKKMSLSFSAPTPSTPDLSKRYIPPLPSPATEYPSATAYVPFGQSATSTDSNRLGPIPFFLMESNPLRPPCCKYFSNSSTVF